MEDVESIASIASKARILALMKGSLDSAVPIISIARHLAAMGHKVTVACGSCGKSLRDRMLAEGILVAELSQRQPPTFLPSNIRKLLEWGRFRIYGRRVLHANFDVVYVGSADTAIALFGLLPKHRYMLHLRELRDTQPFYMYALGPIARSAMHVVVPEINRAHIYRRLLLLERLPTIIPNKPYSHPASRYLPIDFLPPEQREKISSRKCLIYQGPIHQERDLTPVLQALAMSDDYSIIIMGKDYGMLNGYRQIFPELIHIPFLAPPAHLNVTSWAHVGLITYDTDSLNTVYCAPNKIWEYSGFGLPMLCSDNLGLRYTVGAAGAALLVDIEDHQALLNALSNIESDYENFRRRSLAFFHSEDVESTLQSLLSQDKLSASRRNKQQ